MQEAATRQPCAASTSGRCVSRPAGVQRRGRCRLRVQAVQDFSLWRQAELPAQYKQPTVVPGERTLATPRLSSSRVYQRLLESVHERAARHYGAFYSSVLGGITNEPGLMLLHADDHMVTRGHGVYDVIPLVGGCLYMLDEHVERLAAAAEAAGVPAPLSLAALKRILLDTAAASLKLNGHVFVWLTAGRGGLGVSSSQCTSPGLYALVTTEWADPREVFDRTVGWKATVSPVEPPGDYFGSFKNASGLPGTIAMLEAEGRGFDVGLFVDEEGNVISGPASNLAIITHDHTFVYAPFDRAPPGITVQTLAALIPQWRDEDDLPIKAVEQRPITTDDVRGALEAMLLCSTHGVIPLTHLDEAAIGDGTPGELAMALQQVLVNDREPVEGSARHVPVPYGGLTGMESQLI